MRFRNLAFAIALAGLCPCAAWAQPATITAADGVWKTADGEALFVYTGPAEAPPLCDEEACAGGAGWSPLPAYGRTPAQPEWTVVNIATHGRQWSYRGSPLYTRNGAWTDKIAASQPNWRPAVVLQADAAATPLLDAKDPSITAQPARLKGDTPQYPSPSLRTRETGYTEASLCIDTQGYPQYVTTKVTSGFPRLDAATRVWLWRSVRFTPAMVGDKAVAICGFAISSDWKLPGTQQRGGE